MKAILLLVGLAIIGAVAWLIGSTLSPDALGMALGISLGVLAGVPTALLLLAAGRRSEDNWRSEDECPTPAPPQVLLAKPITVPSPQPKLPASADIIDAPWRQLPPARTPSNTQR